jgi:acetyl-CoA carboxylase biotin carboxyl carrier protein
VVDSLAGSAAAEIRIKTADIDLHVRFAPEQAAVPVGETAPEAAPAQPAAAVPEGLVEVAAPMPGMVYLAPAPAAPRFVEAGARVAAGDTLVLVEAMKSMLPVRAPADGTVEAVLVADEEAISAGQVLVRIRPVAA